MSITHIHSFLVRPAKGQNPQPEIGGTTLPLSGSLFEMLSELHQKSEAECTIEIALTHDGSGKQQNDLRDALADYAFHPHMAKGRQLAKRLQAVTTHRSGLGLLFLILGQEKARRRLVVSRFPANSGILAEQHAEDLDVEYLERVFMRVSASYKAALFSGSSESSDFWEGKIVDKQMNNPLTEVSDYWIKDFLLADLKTTSAAGTKRLAVALRLAANSASSTAVRDEIVAACKLAPSLNRQRLTVASFLQRFGLSQTARDAVVEQLRHSGLTGDRFQFSSEEFSRHIAYKSVELSNGGILTADATRFDAVFHRESVKGKSDEFRYSTQGKVTDQTLTKSKR